MIDATPNNRLWEVIEAAKTEPFGFMPFYPEPGLGGHCIPLDPYYLSWTMSEYGARGRFIELAGEINMRMPAYVVNKLMLGLNEQSKALKGSRVCVLGLAYKANIDDDRESPSYEIVELLREAGAKVDYCDPYFPVAHHTRKHGDLGLRSVPLSAESLGEYHALLVATAHDLFKDVSLYARAKLVVDTRNLVGPLFRGAPSFTVVKA